ncbi:MAG: phosphate transport system regulatory protein PhoU [Candidatus Omnitrophica bacterium CG11_big_fil_rev_8_21_14_0_20_63_9]|nr:MAG: phosphate transport system regulatory protein PhoU [Candidatus Omnitrophica bacterium CG11_big_fil_rev_8_21_14_0_20_63_9]
MQRHLDQELTQLKEALVRMAGLAEQSIGLSVKALVSRDAEMARQVIASDDAINQMEIEIDELCLRTLALYQPEAGDLRLIAMALKINNDLERMGDQAVNIAERTVELLKEPLLKPLIDIPRMAELAQRMVKDSLDAFVQLDPAKAKAVCEQDDAVDRYDDQIFRELLTYMMEDTKAITRSVNLILVSRHLERIADHATNIAEDVIYLVEGRNIKHHAQDRSPA